MIKQLEMMKEQIMSSVQSEIGNLKEADAKELGEAVDMIKDLSEAIYYCTITEAMEGKDKEKRETVYYTEKILPPWDNGYYRDMDRREKRMYYPYDYMDGGPIYYTNNNGNGNGNSNGGRGMSGSNGGTRSYTEHDFPMSRIDMRDAREGRSPITRKMYMESKEMGHDKTKKIKELEDYMKELGQDMTEMIHDASPEEKQIMQRKLTELSTKIGQLNV